MIDLEPVRETNLARPPAPIDAPARRDPAGPAVGVVIMIRDEGLRHRVALAAQGLAEALSQHCKGRHAFRAVVADARELAERELAGAMRDGTAGAAIVVSDDLCDEPEGRMNQQPKLGAWGERLRTLFANQLFGSVAITGWTRRIPDVDRTVLRDVTRPALVDAVLRTLRTLEYKSPPSRGELGEPAVIRPVRTREELRDYFSLRHQVYSVMGYLSNEVESAPSGLEIDWCDRNSIPIAAFSTGDGSMLGTTRIILTNAVDPRFERSGAGALRVRPGDPGPVPEAIGHAATDHAIAGPRRDLCSHH